MESPARQQFQKEKNKLKSDLNAKQLELDRITQQIQQKELELNKRYEELDEWNKKKARYLDVQPLAFKLLESQTRLHNLNQEFEELCASNDIEAKQQRLTELQREVEELQVEESREVRLIQSLFKEQERQLQAIQQDIERAKQEARKSIQRKVERLKGENDRLRREVALLQTPSTTTNNTTNIAELGMHTPYNELLSAVSHIFQPLY